MHIKKKITATLTIIIIMNICVLSYADDNKNITDLQSQSSELTEALNDKNNQLKAVQDEISQNMQDLQELDEKIASSEQELNNINIQVEDLNKEIDEKETRLQEIEKEYNDRQDLLDARLLQMYKTPKLEFLDSIFRAKSVSEVLTTYYTARRMSRYDKELLDKMDSQLNEIETTKKILVEKKRQAVEDKQDQQKKAQVLTNTKTMRKYYLSKLSEQELELQIQIDEYNIQVSAIENEIKMLALNSISADYIGGTVVWPVPGYTTLTSSYGMRVHPITGAYKLHTGIDIGAPLNTNFVAAANGIVTKATLNAAYGNMVIIDHGGGVQTLYAHGNEILVQVGQTVSAGDAVLKVGSTGYSTGPHAHFEIRINGQTVNPLEYLSILGKDSTEEKTDTQN